MHVRRAHAGDREALLDLWERSVRATHHFLDESDIVSLRPLVIEELASDAVEWWVLIVSTDSLAGFLGVGPHTIEALFIDPAHQRRGGGALLVAHAQMLAGDGALTVEVNEQNDAAVRFYRSQGFAVISRSPTDSGGRKFAVLRMHRREYSGSPR
jgi:putative acetyltransferase